MSADNLPFLGLPREIRDLIYAALFRSLIFDSAEPQYCREDGVYDPRLAILFTNRQIHAEASSLVLRHASIHCSDTKDMLRFLMSLSPMQIRQLRHLRVGCTLFFFKLPSARDSFMTRDLYGFSVVALLGLFPGLQLDLMELYYPFNGMQVSGDVFDLDIIDSILKVEGFSEIQVFFDRTRVSFPGHWNDSALSPVRLIRNPADLASWKHLIPTRFRSRPGWSLDLSVEKTADTDNDYWGKHRDAGFTLWKDLEVREAAHRYQHSDGGRLHWNFRARRGGGPCVVAEGDDQVLECIRMSSLIPKRAREVSDHLRWLIKENNWAVVDRYEFSCGQHTFDPWG